MKRQARYQLNTFNLKPRTFMEYHFGVHNILHVKYDAVIVLQILQQV